MSSLTSAPTSATKTAGNPLQELHQYGQSAWLDYIRRDLISTGELERLIKHDGLGGMTSNPAIEKAITGSTLYTETLLDLQSRSVFRSDGDLRASGHQRYPGRGRCAASGV